MKIRAIISRGWPTTLRPLTATTSSPTSMTLPGSFGPVDVTYTLGHSAARQSRNIFCMRVCTSARVRECEGCGECPYGWWGVVLWV